MGCRCTRIKDKIREPPHQRYLGELHYVNEYGQPMAVQERRGCGHRRQQSRCVTECNTPPERHWEALRAMGMVEGEESQRNRFLAGPHYGHMAVSPALYSTNSHMMMSSDAYPHNGFLPRSPNEHHLGNNFLPAISYSLDHLDRLDYQEPEMSPYQPNSESCLIERYSNEGPNNVSRQVDHSWLSDRPLGFLPLSELDSGLGCAHDSPNHQFVLSEAETDALSSLPGHTPSSQGSSSSSESLISSEPSDSGFHSVSTGEHRRLRKIHTGPHLHLGLCARDQRGRWDLESIPETTPVTHEGVPWASHCTVGNSTTTTVHFHRAEKSPTLPRHQSLPSPSMGCRTEPCHRRALWLEQQQGVHGMVRGPGRSRTIQDLSEGHRRRRASHPNMMDQNSVTNKVQSTSPGADGNTLAPTMRASYPSNPQPTGPFTVDRAGPTNQKGDCLAKSPGSDSRGASDWRGFQTLGNQYTGQPKVTSVPCYNTLGTPTTPPQQQQPHSPPSPRSRTANQKSIRNQLLRARASRLARERSEVTTDEEVRVRGDVERDNGRLTGRYCSRTERRRHLALSRQHKEKRGGGGGGGGGGGFEEPTAGVLAVSPSSQTLLELTHMKQNQLRNSKLLDNWTTVEELLTHGTRMESDSQLCPSPLLSVTTV